MRTDPSGDVSTAAESPPVAASSPVAAASAAPRGARAALRVALLIALVALVALALPFLAPLVLAAWLAAAGRPLLAILAEKLGRRSRAAAVLTLSFFVLLVGPALALAASLSMDAIQLGNRLASSRSGREALAQLVSTDEVTGSTFDPAAVFAMVERHGARALELASTLAGIGTELAIGLFVFFTAAYVLLVDGPAAWTWTLRHAPIDPRGLERLRSAFHETGRGIFIGIGLTGLAQAALATAAYLALGIPRAFVLGLLTLIASVFPTVGTALVWLPVSIALAITGRTTAALVLVVIGVVLVSGIDNVLRPALTRWGHLELHTFVLLIAMLGGLALMGPAGIFLGPLIARLAVEIVRMARDAGLVGRLT
ncbi:MAG: AI-2E family transporter [Myxococcota bacterium]|nr:AI-2E family transporter [Myxococcota bacterium]